jgi:hypothetical protein
LEETSARRKEPPLEAELWKRSLFSLDVVFGLFDVIKCRKKPSLEAGHWKRNLF